MFFKNYSDSWIIFIYQFFSYFVSLVEILENISLKNFLGNIQNYCARYLMNIFLSVHTISFKNFLIHRYSNLTRTRGTLQTIAPLTHRCNEKWQVFDWFRIGVPGQGTHGTFYKKISKKMEKDKRSQKIICEMRKI